MSTQKRCFHWFVSSHARLCLLQKQAFERKNPTLLLRRKTRSKLIKHDDVIKWKHFPRNWPFVREIHRSPVNFPHKGQWRGALMFSLIYAWINDWVNNREAGDLRRQHGHYDVIVMHTLWIVLAGELLGVCRRHDGEKWPQDVTYSLYQ